MSTPVAGTIAGSDSGGGAGIQADLKTFAANGVYGCSVVVAVTAQDTLGVRGFEVLSPGLVGAQVDAIAEDFAPRSWKTGMLATAGVIEVVVDRLKAHAVERLVVDPVMVSKSGASLLDPAAVAVLRGLLLPLALVVTPNLPEAEALTGRAVDSPGAARDAARAIAAMGPRYVVVKGGHAGTDPVVDLVFDSEAGTWTELSRPRVPGSSTHGTGCTFSAAIAAFLALGHDPIEAVEAARDYLQSALLAAPGLGRGHGPLGHFPEPPAG